MSEQPDDAGPDCRRCGKPTGKWWLQGAGTDADHRRLCSDCDAAEMQRAFALPVRLGQEPTP